MDSQDGSRDEDLMKGLGWKWSRELYRSMTAVLPYQARDWNRSKPAWVVLPHPDGQKWWTSLTAKAHILVLHLLRLCTMRH